MSKAELGHFAEFFEPKCLLGTKCRKRFKPKNTTVFDQKKILLLKLYSKKVLVTVLKLLIHLIFIILSENLNQIKLSIV